ncbi:MAG: hypothetical protein IBJ18_00350 [Phycisphaerales bacterium]|nr:hypothetical protein [Phycisphaerales bacterium]
MNSTPPTPNNPRHTDDHLIDAELRQVNGLLETLAARDAQGLSPQALDRIARAGAQEARASSQGDSPALRLTEFEAKVARHQMHRVTMPRRYAAAAMIAITCGLGALAWMNYANRSTTNTPGSGGTSVASGSEQSNQAVASTENAAASEIASMLSAVAWLDDSSSELASLNTDADSLFESIKGDPLSVPEVSGGIGGGTGSM